MTEKEIIIHSSKNRIIFTMIGLVLSGIILVTSMFYLEALSYSISKSIPLKPNEYHLFMDETRFETVPKNYYQTLLENMINVIPFVVRDEVFMSNQVQIIGTDLDGLKLYQNQQFYDLDIIESLTTTTAYPKISVDASFYAMVSNPIIQIHNGTFEIQSVFELKNGVETPYPSVMLDLHSMANFIDSSIRSNVSGIEKFYIEHYYIQSEHSIKETILYLETLYGDPAIMAFLQTHDSLLKERMSTFILIESVPVIIFILILLFSWINIFIAIQLTIKERRSFYAILSILGMNVKRLRKLIIQEFFYISVLSALISVVLGIVISVPVIAFTQGLTFQLVDWWKMLLVFISIVVVPVGQTMLSVQFIRYKHFSKVSLA